jgi:hypothetical protein
MVKFKSHGKCSTDITRWSISLAIYDVGRSSKMSYFHGHGPLGSKKEFEGCYVQQFWSRNQGQPACFPKKSKLHELDDVWDESKPLLGGNEHPVTSCFHVVPGFWPTAGPCLIPFIQGSGHARSCRRCFEKKRSFRKLGGPGEWLLWRRWMESTRSISGLGLVWEHGPSVEKTG